MVDIATFDAQESSRASAIRKSIHVVLVCIKIRWIFQRTWPTKGRALLPSNSARIGSLDRQKGTSRCSERWAQGEGALEREGLVSEVSRRIQE